MEKSKSTLENDAVRAIVDRQAILDCLLRYARGVDRVDENLIRSAFWPDAYDAHGAFNGSPDDFLSYFLPKQPAREVSQHLLLNHMVELKGSTADAETYFISVAKLFGSEGIEMVGGRYIDSFEKRHGEWRIKTRLVLPDWQTLNDASGMAKRLAGSHRGSRGQHDPSYRQSGWPLISAAQHVSDKG